MWPFSSFVKGYCQVNFIDSLTMVGVVILIIGIGAFVYHLICESCKGS